MDKAEHLLICLAEECAEVTHRVSKAIRFSLDEIEPGQPLTNAERIAQEFNDLLGVVELLEEEGVLNLFADDKAVEFKKAKVRRYMEHAKRMGTLS